AGTNQSPAPYNANPDFDLAYVNAYNAAYTTAYNIQLNAQKNSSNTTVPATSGYSPNYGIIDPEQMDYAHANFVQRSPTLHYNTLVSIAYNNQKLWVLGSSRDITSTASPVP